MKTGNYKHLTQEQQLQLQMIENIPDDKIDLSDMPEKLDWSNARQGMFRPVKQQLTVRFDADVVYWFRQSGDNERGYQTRMNEALREYMLTHDQKIRVMPSSTPATVHSNP